MESKGILLPFLLLFFGDRFFPFPSCREAVVPFRLFDDALFDVLFDLHTKDFPCPLSGLLV